MDGNCPRCRTGMHLPESGAYRCPRCRTDFQVYLAAPPPPPLSAAGLPPIQGDDALSGARCAMHGSNPAAGICERCGDFMCALCATPFEGRSYCPRCFDLLWDRGSLAAAQAPFTTPRSALTLGIVACVLFCNPILNVPMGIVAIILGASALRQIGLRPDLPGRPQAVAGIVLGGAAMLLSILFRVLPFFNVWN